MRFALTAMVAASLPVLAGCGRDSTRDDDPDRAGGNLEALAENAAGPVERQPADNPGTAANRQ